MWRNSFDTCGDGQCPCRAHGGGRPRRVALSAARRASLARPRLLSTERRICCTHRLVRIYNNTANTREREVLGRWLSSLVAVFGKLDSYQKAEVAEELAHLANVEARSARDRKLVLRVVSALGEATTDNACAETIAEALSRVLASLDVTVFEGDPATLLRLAATLTVTLRSCVVQTRQTFRGHRPALVALYQACTLIQRVAPALPACNYLKEKQDGLLQGLKIFGDAPYYPFRFYAILIEQCIHRMTKGDETSALFQAMQRLATGTVGVLDFYRGVRQVDPSAVSKGIQKLRTACADDRLRRKLWFDWLQTLSSAAMLCLTDPEKFELFLSGLEHTLEYQSCLSDEEECKAVRFGIVNELTAVATAADSAVVRRKAMFEFQYLATCRALSEGWNEDPEIYEGLLDAASKIFRQGEFGEYMKPVLETLTSSLKSHLRQTIRSWLGNKTLEHKLRSLLEEEEEEELSTVCHGLLLQYALMGEMASWRDVFWLNRTVDSVHQV